MKHYAVASVSWARKLFPGYSRGDERYSLDGSQVILEPDLTDDQAEEINKAGNARIMTHPEIVQFLAENEAEWTPGQVTPVPGRKGKGRASTERTEGSS